MTRTQIESELRLFKSYTIGVNESYEGIIHEQAYGKGLLFLEEPPMSVMEIADTMYGKNEEKWNQTFHKSFSTVRDLPIETLIAQQLIHYFTTYGLEALGAYDKDLVYIPAEQLEIPELEEDIPLIVIKKISEEELSIKLQTLLTSGIALSKETIEDIMTLSDYIDKTKFDEIKNREIKMALYEKYKIVPKNNIEFLRYLILKVTGSTLLIQNKTMLKTIKDLDDEKYELAYGLINGYISNKNGYIKLAEIFLRYKNIFLAFKRNEKKGYAPSMNKIINKISKLAKTYHKPLQTNILDTLSQVKHISDLDQLALQEALNDCTIFREVRILNGLLYRLNTDKDSIVYKIRNGKGYVDKYDKNLSVTINTAQSIICDIIKNHIINRLDKTLKGKSIYIPDNITYAFPTSEKQFNGNIPEGSFIEVPRSKSNMVVGVHWTNLGSERVDLDLHIQNRTEQYGWNTSYRSDSSNFYFSGDVTDASKPLGATEVYFIGRDCDEKAFLMTLNDYTSNNKEIPFEFLIAEASDSSIEKNYVVDPNKVLTTISNKFEKDVNQKTLGFLRITKESIRFYFNDFTLGNSIVTRQSDITKRAYDYLEDSVNTQIKLLDILKQCNVTFLDQPYKEELLEAGQDDKGNTLYIKVTKKADYDLSLENISKETLIKLLTEA